MKRMTLKQITDPSITDICRDSLDHRAEELVGGERPHLTVLVDLGMLTGARNGRSELADGTILTPEAARRIACDAGVVRMITRGESEILDVGRRTRTIPPALRRALEVRDGGCRWGDCSMPGRYCDAHHVIHWADGGETSLENTILYCRHHHRMIHRRRGPPARAA